MQILKRKRRGSVIDVLSVGICILAMSIIMMAYLNSLYLVNTKAEVSQTARKYILRMETVGCLTAGDRSQLLRELSEIGVKDVDLTGTTVTAVDYGSPIVLSIKGNMQGKEMSADKGLFATVFLDKLFSFQEVRASTAKN